MARPVVRERSGRFRLHLSADERDAVGTFVEQLPFVTGTGKVDRVVTPLCIFRRDPERNRLAVESIHPYSSAEEVAAHTGFGVDLAGVAMTPAPSEQEIAALERIDPEGVRRIEFS